VADVARAETGGPVAPQTGQPWQVCSISASVSVLAATAGPVVAARACFHPSSELGVPAAREKDDAVGCPVVDDDGGD
jgi:hypothetical protein